MAHHISQSDLTGGNTATIEKEEENTHTVKAVWVKSIEDVSEVVKIILHLKTLCCITQWKMAASQIQLYMTDLQSSTFARRSGG